MNKTTKNLIIVTCLISMIYCSKTNAALLENEPVNITATQTIAQGIVPSDETLEAIPGFGVVSDSQLYEILVNGTQDVWPSVIYVKNEYGQFFNPNTGVLVGEIGQIEKSQDNLFRIVTPTRTSEWTTLHGIRDMNQIGFLTALSKNGKNEYVMITGEYWKAIFSLRTLFGSYPSRLAVRYVDKSNKEKVKYLDLFTTQSGWNHIFYQPISQPNG